MAAPFLFTPAAGTVPLGPTPYLQQYYGQHPHTPVMVPAAPLAPGQVSPVPPQLLLVPPTPGMPASPGRPVSWHGTPQAAPVQFPPPKSPQVAPVQFPPKSPAQPAAMLPVFPAPPSPHLHMPALGHGRRASFGQAAAPAWIPYGTPQMAAGPVPGQQWMFMPTGPGQVVAPAAPEEPKGMLHPFLDGSTKPPGGELWFDLSAHEFVPLRRLPNGTVIPLSAEELNQPATHPPTTKMKIFCEAVPQWPTDLTLDPVAPPPVAGLDLAGVPQWYQDRVAIPPEENPITLRDVLEGVYRTLQSQITHVEWGKLSRSEEMAVSRAFTRRIKNAGDAGDEETSLGVKRIDYLLDKFMFRGLVPTKDSKGFENCKIVVSASK